MKIHQNMWIQKPLFKNMNQRSLTPRWPWTTLMLRSPVWLYARIIVSKSHGITSMYVDTVIIFVKIPHTTYIHSSCETKTYCYFQWLHHYEPDQFCQGLCPHNDVQHKGETPTCDLLLLSTSANACNIFDAQISSRFIYCFIRLFVEWRTSARIANSRLLA